MLDKDSTKAEVFRDEINSYVFETKVSHLFGRSRLGQAWRGDGHH